MKDTRKDKYSDFDELAAFGFLANALGGGHHTDGDTGQSFPRSDEEDLSRGLRFIPGEVTLARRRGEKIYFVQDCSCPCCWYWQFADGSRTYYWERWAYEEIAQRNGAKGVPGQYDTEYPDGVGKCPTCGNVHLSGGHIAKNAL